MMRITREECFMEVAKIIAKRSTCPRASVGAVLVADNRIVATGYNGSASGTAHCIDLGCLLENGHCRRTVHAEMNALLHIEHRYDSLTLFCTHQPCYQCLKALISCNVNLIYYAKPYDDEIRDELAVGANIIMTKMGVYKETL